MGSGLSKLLDAFRLTPTAANVGSYAKIVSECSAARSLHNHLRKQADRIAGGMADTDEVADTVRNGLRDGREAGNLVSIADAAMEAYEDIEAVVMGRKTTIKTGIGLLDLLTGGFRKGEMTILAAHTGVGKSAFSMQIVDHVAKDGHGTMVCSLEMTRKQYLQRMYAQRSGIPVDAMDRKDGISDEQWEILGGVASDVSRLPIHFMTQTRTIEGLRAIVEAKPPKLLVIDYLQLMDTKKRIENEVNRLGAISGALKSIALDLNIPVLALAQLKRTDSQQRAAIIPILSDLRGSGNMEQDADNVIFLHRPDAESDKAIDLRDKELFKKLAQTDNKRLIIVNTAKQRQGKLGRFPMVFQMDLMRFLEIDRRQA
jgi:replicative DNA helicase